GCLLLSTFSSKLFAVKVMVLLLSLVHPARSMTATAAAFRGPLRRKPKRITGPSMARTPNDGLSGLFPAFDVVSSQAPLPLLYVSFVATPLEKNSGHPVFFCRPEVPPIHPTYFRPKFCFCRLMVRRQLEEFNGSSPHAFCPS